MTSMMEPGFPMQTMRNRGMSESSNDPFAMQPPRNETATQKQARLRAESIARKRSEQIDRFIKEDVSKTRKERANERTILLLGENSDEIHDPIMREY